MTTTMTKKNIIINCHWFGFCLVIKRMSLEISWDGWFTEPSLISPFWVSNASSTDQSRDPHLDYHRKGSCDTLANIISWQPYHPAAQDWLPTEAKQGWVWSVPGWETSWEN